MTSFSGTIESPCVRNCCLDDNDVCMGCFRTLDEIKDWQMASDAAKQSILLLCQQRRSTSRLKHRNK